jgi:hypothetical protein
MKGRRPTPIFRIFNPDHSRCSAWIQNDNRHCHEKLRTTDQRMKNLLLWIVSTNHAYGGDEAKRAVDLCFCDGWHRPGGTYAISLSERLKGFQALFPGRPVPTSWCIPAPRQWEPSAPNSVNAEQSATSRPSATEDCNFLGGNSSVGPAEHLAVRRPPLQDAPRASWQPPEQVAETTRDQGLDARGLQDYGSPSPATVPARRSTPIRGAPALSRPMLVDWSKLPLHDFGNATGFLGQRWDRVVNVDERCQICTERLRDPQTVIRCSMCCNDTHTSCIERWWRSSHTCPYW